MTLYDISLTLTENLPTWPGDPPLQLARISAIDQGDTANVTHISTSVHVGTHIDAPDHFLNNGKTVENIPPELLVGTADLVEVSAQDMIRADDLRAAGVSAEHKRLLIKTTNSAYWREDNLSFQEDFLALDKDAAEFLVECRIELVGIDYLSIAPFQDPEPTHQILLGAGILVIEGLDLSAVEPGEYTLMCLPLKIGGAEGAPARALLQGLD